MKLSRFLTTLFVFTVFSLVYIELQVQIYDLGYKGEKKKTNIQKLMDDNFIPLKDRDLAYLPESNPAFKNYITDLLWAQDFALLNREEMMDRVMTELSYLFYKENGHQAENEAQNYRC